MKQLYLDKNGIYVVGEDMETISYPGSGNDSCFAIESNSFWFRHRNNVINEVLHKYEFDGNFADIGGGNGFQARFIQQNSPNKTVYLIEPGYQGCLNARKNGIENVYNMFFQDFDFEVHNIGGVGLFDVVEHIENDVLFFEELSTCLKKGTYIFMTVPAHNFLWSDTDDYAGHFRRYNSGMVKNLAKKANLKLVYNRYFMTYLPLPIYIARAIPYKIRGKRDNNSISKKETDQHSTGKLSGMVVEFLNNIELSLIRNFGGLRFGGSCICVFQTQ
jgi:hypothetical protein